MSTLIQDVRYALRQLRKAPGFTAAVVFTLALGIGLNAAIFTMVDCVLLRPLGYHDADRIVALKTQFVKEGRSIPRLGGGDYVDLTHQVKSLEAVAYYGGPFKDGAQLGTRAVYTDITSANPEFFAVMGVQPVAGRLFSAEGANSDVVVSSGFARDHFATVADAVGKPISYDSKPRIIVGVVPDGFGFPGKTSIWVETAATPDNLNRTAYNQQAIGKLREGASPVQLSAELSTLSGQLSRQYVEDKEKALIAVPLQERIVGSIRPLLRLLMGSVFVVLLIVCGQRCAFGNSAPRHATRARSPSARRSALLVEMLYGARCWRQESWLHLDAPVELASRRWGCGSSYAWRRQTFHVSVMCS